MAIRTETKSSLKSRSKQTGLSLIEVLVALGIFCSTALIILETYQSHISALQDSQKKQFASHLANNVLSDYHLLKIEWPNGNKHIEKLQFAQYEWTVQLTQSNLGGKFQRLDVSVWQQKKLYAQHSLIQDRIGEGLAP